MHALDFSSQEEYVYPLLRKRATSERLEIKSWHISIDRPTVGPSAYPLDNSQTVLSAAALDEDAFSTPHVNV
jgi:hypothetical protein